MRRPRRILPLDLPFDGALRLPGSKSEANRALVAAALTPGRTRIHGATPGDDVCRMVEGLQALGFRVRWHDREGGVVDVDGGLPAGDSEDETRIDCGNAGTTLRFLVSVATLIPGGWVLDGDDHMRQRPVGDLVDAWKKLGAEIEAPRGRPPVTVRGGGRRGGKTTLDASKSSQFLTSLLLVGSVLEGGLSVEVEGDLASRGYLTLTREVLRRFAVNVEIDDKAGSTAYRVSPRAEPSQPPIDAWRRYEVEGDWSAAGTFHALAEISGGTFRGQNLNPESVQSDRQILDHLKAMRDRGDLVVDVSETPDQLMNLAIVAARRSAATHFVGAATLRWKECDRLAITTRELRRAAIRVEEHDTGLTVHGTPKVDPGHFDPEDDHRMAMMIAILGCVAPGTQLLDARCVNKSYPGFFEDLENLRRQVRPIAFIGMRGCGKSTLGKLFAEHFSLPSFDTDLEFEKVHGPLADFVTARSWPEFRRHEEDLVAEALSQPGIVALGGGAIESSRNRDALQQHATTVWIDESPEVLRERLRRAPGGRPVLEAESPDILRELEEILGRRRELYATTADLILPPRLSLEAQLAFLIEELKRSCSW